MEWDERDRWRGAGEVRFLDAKAGERALGTGRLENQRLAVACDPENRPFWRLDHPLFACPRDIVNGTLNTTPSNPEHILCGLARRTLCVVGAGLS